MPSADPAPQSLVASIESTRDLRRRLYRTAWPVILENLLQSATFMINTALAGRLGAAALSAAGISNFLLFFGFTLFLGLGVGMLAQVARAVGARDRAGAQRVAWHGLALGTALSGASTLVLVLFAAPILRLAGADEEMVAIGAPYLRLASAFAPFQMLTVLLGAMLRASGDTRNPMHASLLMTAVNTLVGFLLVFDVIGPGGLGLLGIAIAFSLARVVAAIYMGLVVRRSDLGGGLWQGRRFDRVTLRRVIRVSLPAAGEQAAWSGGILAVSVVGLSLGTVSFAAQSVIGPVTSIAFMPSFGLGVAASALVGQSLGAKLPDLAKRFGFEAATGATLISSLMAIVILVAPRQVMAVFTSDPAVIDAGETPLRIIAAALPLYGPANTFSGVLRGAGDTRAMFAIGLAGLWVARLPLALILGVWIGLGLAGIWLAVAADFLVRAVASYARFASGKWQSIDV